MRRPPERKAEGQHPLAEMDPKAFEKLPLIRGFFLDATYADDGKERSQGFMILRADPTRWSVTLKEPTSGQQLYVAAPTLSDLYKIVEASLGDDKAQWVKDEWALQRSRRAGPKRG